MSRRTTASRRDLHNHYRVEVELAARLRNTPADARPAVYQQVYDELFARVPDHPQLRVDEAARDAAVRERLDFVRRVSRARGTIVEVGAGDCRFSREAARFFARTVAVDVSETIVADRDHDSAIELFVIDGIHFPLADGTADVVFSDQLMEHLHPDDAWSQLLEVRRILSPGGAYVCITPNRAGGPHDISGLYVDEALGFHLREYTSVELARLFASAGFDRVSFYAGGRGRYVRVPASLLGCMEAIVLALPKSLHRRLRRSPLAYALLGLNVVATTARGGDLP